MGSFLYSVASFSIVILFYSSQPVYAYIDPGTGSIIIQSVIGGIAAATTFGAIYWSKLKTIFTRKNKETDKTGGDSGDK